MINEITLAKDIRPLISLKILQQLEPGDINLVTLKLHGTTVKDIAAKLDLTSSQVTNKLKTVVIKEAMEDASNNIKHGLIKPTDMASQVEKEVLEEYFRLLMNDDTDLKMKLKFGDAILKYRQSILSAMQFTNQSPLSSPELIPVKPITKQRMDEYLDNEPEVD